MSTDLKELAREISRARGCEAEVARRGERDVYEKPPVAFVCEVADGHEFYWPACAWHVNRYGPGVPLSDIVAALRELEECWTERGHVCQRPSGNSCIEPGCKQEAGTAWGPYWCPDHDVERLERINRNLNAIADMFGEAS